MYTKTTLLLSIFLIINSTQLLAQDLENSPYETKYNSIDRSALSILYKHKAFQLGDSFEAVASILGDDPKYAGPFVEFRCFSEYTAAEVDRIIIFEDCTFLIFVERELAYFSLKSDVFEVKLTGASDANQEVVAIKNGQALSAVNVFEKAFPKSYQEKITIGDSYNDILIVNVGGLNGADSVIGNNFLISLDKGTDRVNAFHFFGYW